MVIPKTKQGIVSAGHEKTAEAAIEILRMGGNAFDAAVGAGFAACVAEAVLASLGGGGFLLAHSQNKSRKTQEWLYDFFVQTPQHKPKTKADQAALDFYPIEADFGPTTQEFHIGLGSMATPGVIAGLFRVHQDLGSLPIAEVIRPAIHLAKDGFFITPFQEYLFGVVASIFSATPEAARLFCSPQDKSSSSKQSEHIRLQAGDVLRFPQLASALEALAQEGPSLFYEGELAQRLVKLCQEKGGLLSEKDLSDYRVERRIPLAWHYRGHRMLSNPPPSSGGILIAFALELLEAKNFSRESFDHLETLQDLITAMALTNEARLEALAQHPRWEEACQTLQEKNFVKKYRELLLGKAKSSRGTTHLNVMDSEGNAASLTLSNGEGCGYLLPGTDIMLNNMLGEEDLNPQGFYRWHPNERMVSMMAPTLSFAPDGSMMALGSGGSNRIRSAILQVLKNCIDHQMSLQQAVEAPRVHFEKELLSIEPGFSQELLVQLFRHYPKNHLWEQKNLFFGGVHAVAFHPQQGFSGVGDSRRYGVVKVG